MCDTMVALGDATSDGSVILAKNSDRLPNEANALVVVPAAEHRPGSRVKCTYVEIEQVPHTFAVLLAKPHWIWGAEMGANERGVAIGNEAVFTRDPYERGPGLIGMDFLRLGLERAANAREALQVIVRLLEEHGQGGSCVRVGRAFYHNSFLIADPAEAWVLETSGRQWAAERVLSIRSISNAITIGNRWDLASEGLVQHALERGWCKSASGFDFGRCYSDPRHVALRNAIPRQCRTAELLGAGRGAVTVASMMGALRDHGPRTDPPRSPADPGFGVTVCMHAGCGKVRTHQTTGSLVSHLMPGRQTHWVTGSAAPCISIFKPVWIDAGLPDLGPSPGARYDAASLWWRHEAFHRDLLRDYGTRLARCAPDRDRMELGFLAYAENTAATTADERAALSARCLHAADEAVARWAAEIHGLPVQHRSSCGYRSAWRRRDRAAGRQARYQPLARL